jgi:hypothetical protein
MNLTDGDTTMVRWAWLAALLGGILWMPYGLFEMLEPWGAATSYRDDLGYEVVTATARYRVYALPGGLATLLTALGLFGLPATFLGRPARSLALVAAGLAVVAVAGAVLPFDPLFTVGCVFGTLALGVATALTGLVARRAGAARWSVGLSALGLLGIGLLPLWPLVYALGWVSTWAGAALIATFGLGWFAIGCRLWVGSRPPTFRALPGAAGQPVS